MSTHEEEANVRSALRRMGLIDADETPALTPLSGGVSSLILRADTRRGPVCVKQALPALKVATEWLAPLARNHAEVAWLREVARHAPQAVPTLLGEDPERYCFAMDWLPPDEYPVWKLLLRDGDASPGFAAEVAQIVAGIHARTAHDPVLAERFANDRNFFELRLDPYFIAASRAHPDCAPVLTALATSTAGRRIALVHGDISPKNLLAGPHGPIILDAECAWYGDPAFDAAFCLCHLLAKCLWQPAHADLYLQSFDAFAAAYLARVDWEARTANDGAEGIESRIAWLLAGLLLARVDGKSPLEYLDEPGRQRQRRFAREWLLAPLPAAQRTLGAMREGWQQLLGSPG